MMLCVRMNEGMSQRNPMKKILIAAALIVSGLLSGCNQLTQYTVSEQEINQALQKRNHFAKDIGLKGVADAKIER